MFKWKILLFVHFLPQTPIFRITEPKHVLNLLYFSASERLEWSNMVVCNVISGSHALEMKCFYLQ